MNRFLKKQFLLLILLFIFVSLKANRPFPEFRPLSDASKISLLTCDPGDQLYNTFGHSAIRIYDPMQGKDIVFNYGTFNFNVPNFYVKFASGKLLYRLSYERYRQFMAMYVYQDRTVIEQELNLTKFQRQQLLEEIRENYKIENRYYKYDFFFDNCATRIIDIYAHTYGDSLVCSSEIESSQKTFRALLNEYLGKSDWSAVGINLLLGNVTDVAATELEKSFLPDYLLIYIRGLKINNKPFVKSEKYLVEGSFSAPKTPFLLSPKFWFWFLFLLIAVLSYLFRFSNWIIADRSIFIVLGIIGVLVFLATFATDHDAMRNNMNLLWINPLFLIYAGLIGSRYKQVLFYVGLFIIGSCLLVLLGWSFLPQNFHPLYIPVVLLTILRAGVISIGARL